MTKQPARTTSNQQGNIVVIVLAVVALLLVGAGGGYFLLNSLNKPAQIKQTVEPIQQSFDNYNRAVKNISDDLTEEGGGSDADSIERALQKSRGLIKVADDALAILEPQVTKINFSETDPLKNDLQNHLSKSKSLLQIERDNVDSGEKIVSPIRDYQKLASDLGGVSSYMYSDSAKYVQIVTDFIQKDNKIISDLSAVNAKGDARETLDSVIKTMQSEKTFLEDIVLAVKSRDSVAIAAAQKSYTQNSTELEKETNRISDKHKDNIKNLTQDLESLSDKIKSSFSTLKAKYNF